MKNNKKHLIATLLMVLTLSIGLIGCTKAKTEAEKPAQAPKTAEKKDYNYYTAEQLKKSIEAKEEILILDIQVKEEYDKHHIKGAIPTYAYPVKSDEDKKKLENILGKLEGSKPIIIVCPKGGGGAENTYKYLTEKNISKDRLYILEKGQAAWPYDELLEK
ncbi:rhodanese-like domain-containing protein [Clostridium algidicarnis]|uniref:rhodanese-like domain-containing protein n=1 Tax=Clostridium algidicarnis TaxID=37659 RepID=UPI001C0C8B6F|nr:rhodanese-like domain-containing protein [Clostridium algidicarnis]MBU3195727.1 rhodanese-like domain-containing protein [Clostridium algidicarnis]MBU3208749.1 rhodanese-like domain-containing protein [Clostridium algidicarnis]MBU3226740.1 rhodanese-like domain-containing protein [Clostridium algidicarnis]MBU3250349.1 rhodanese-like domain-containing protein [Clostridium algidicarnis]